MKKEIDSIDLKKTLPMVIVVTLIILIVSIFLIEKVTYSQPKKIKRNDFNEEIEYYARKEVDKSFGKLSNKELLKIEEIAIFQDVESLNGLDKLDNLETLIIDYLKAKNNLSSLKNNSKLKNITINGGFLDKEDMAFFKNNRIFKLHLNNVTLLEGATFPKNSIVHDLSIQDVKSHNEKPFRNVKTINSFTIENSSFHELGINLYNSNNLRKLHIDKYTYLEEINFLKNKETIQDLILDITYIDKTHFLKNMKNIKGNKIKFIVDDDNYNLDDYAKMIQKFSDNINQNGEMSITISAYNQ